ncbi:MAG TPA: D-alanyl-D-alanine carboxypeptidase/D-alanyl-D-alanine-endopeptidase [Steroidobacteraceae bacterium]|nr:D-alanyl-D-alanine carboxypeptidase/D-alanyl-D-alanine-endopeptidase [Steroidobacteraceae bacterium]
MNHPAFVKSLALFIWLVSSTIVAAPATTARQGETALAVTPATYLSRLAAARIPSDAAAVIVRPLDGGALSWEANASRPMNPASTMKLVTTYSALHLLGPAFTFRTEVLSEAPVIGEALRGDLYVRGGGDPKLVIEDLWYLASRLRGFGVREIRGDLVLDKGLFEPLRHDPAQFDGEEGRAYNVGPDALLLNFKSIAIHLVPDPVGKVARVIVVPEISGLTAPRTVPLVDGGCGDWRGRLGADLADPMNIRIRGTYPAACGERIIHMGALEHTNYFAAVFRALWERQGGTWTGKVREAAVPAGARLIVAQESPPLAMLIRDINKFSNNVMTQQLFLTMGAAGGEPGNPARGGAAVRNLLSARGIEVPGLVLENGCGLSRIERISVTTLADVLTDAWKSQWMPELMASLPISGVDGTMKARNVPSGAAHMKTGLLEDTRAVAGYVMAASGKRYVVVAIINHPNAGGGTGAHDALIDWVYRNG